MTARETLVPVDFGNEPDDDIDVDHEYVMTTRVRLYRDFDAGSVQIDIPRGIGTHPADWDATWQRVDPDPELPTEVGAVIHCQIAGVGNSVQVAELLDEDAWYVVGEQLPYGAAAIERVFHVLWAGGDR